MGSRRLYIELALAFADARQDVINKEPGDVLPDMLDGVDLAAECVSDVLKRLDKSFDCARFLENCKEGS